MPVHNKTEHLSIDVKYFNKSQMQHGEGPFHDLVSEMLCFTILCFSLVKGFEGKMAARWSTLCWLGGR